MNRKNGSGFFVDKVSEESFHKNLLLGLPYILDKSPNIHEKFLKCHPPATKLQVKNWEILNEVNLPTDLYDFYLSCNGLSYTYTFSYEPTNREDLEVNKMKAKIGINPIDSLNLVQGYRLKPNARIWHDGSFYNLELNKDSKVFELSDEIYHKVVLVYLGSNSASSIWINKKGNFYYISNDITTYLRKAVAHLGVPNWQYIFSPLGLPERSKEMLNIIAPGILDRTVALDKNVSKINKINRNIFNNIIDEDSNRIKSNNDNISNKRFSSNTVSGNLSSTTIERRASTVTIDRKTNSLVSSVSESLKKKASSRRRPFTPRF